jgi:hypothetical protein
MLSKEKVKLNFQNKVAICELNTLFHRKTVIE